VARGSGTAGSIGVAKVLVNGEGYYGGEIFGEEGQGARAGGCHRGRSELLAADVDPAVSGQPAQRLVQGVQ
jgi:hypothetical protein